MPRALKSMLPILILALAWTAHAAGDAGQPMLGFSPAGAAAERALEARFDAQLKPADMRDWLERLSARPHHVGSPYGKENAEFMLGLFRSWGFDAQIEEFKVLFPTPKTRVVELVAPTRFTAALAEPPLPEDHTSNQTAEQLPVYNAYSIDGDVTADLVYVNYGVPRDYDELARRGVDVKGKIVLARYGGSWRGIKPKVAAEHGAIGCIIYSDPHEDGYFLGDVYPKGGYRPERGAQRGSVADMPLYPGDPLTPGIGATADAKRLPVKDAPTLTKIPVLPISYADARPLLAALGGPMAPEAWRGALALPYHLGPGPAKVHLKLEFNWNLVSARDVVAKLAGAERPDEWIVRGNHHDGWVNGADDPLSGQIAMLSEARALGALAKTGWRPKRTVVYCAWDGEEPGLLGSTEWAETHADLLREKAAVYINSDSNSRGYLDVGGSHTLEKFLNQVARDVRDPEKGVSVADRKRAAQLLAVRPGNAPEQQRERHDARERADFRIEPLGSGSDYTPFLQHLGIAALNIGFEGEGHYGQYHSIYDSFDHYVRFMDPRFEYGVALAQTGGRLVLRLAGADVLPFEFDDFAETLGRYVDEVAKLADDLRDETAETNRRLADKTYDACDDPTETWLPPQRYEPVPYLDFSPLRNAVATLSHSVEEYDRAVADLGKTGRELPPEAQQALDQVLMKSERALTRSEGLPRRPWFVHHVYAPGFYTGYGVKTLPGVREAIEQRNWKEAADETQITARVIEGFAKEVDRATALLRAQQVAQR
jgi:N-acetylated-alpha-linked acidic dipeptidase